MINTIFTNFYFISDIFFLVSLLTIIPICVFYNSNLLSSGQMLSLQVRSLVLFLFLFLFLLSYNYNFLDLVLLNGSLIKNALTYWFTFLVIFGTTIICILSFNYIKWTSFHEYEFFLILSLVLMGMLLLIISNDFLSVYLGVELQSLGLYILATLKQNSTFSTEAGLKYFILGAFASSLLLFGITLLYCITGLLNFSDLSLLFESLDSNMSYFYGVFISLNFVLISLIFKLGGFPFHMWVPDVYEGVNTLVTSFFALVPKLTIMSLILKIVHIVYVSMTLEIEMFLFYSAFFSILIGGIGGLYQRRLKRLLSYSAIGHTGFLLLALSSGSDISYVVILFYFVVYMLLVINIFSIFLNIQRRDTGLLLKYVSNLSYIYNSNKLLSISFLFGIFSIAGVPPLSGFFAKISIYFSVLTVTFTFYSLLLLFIVFFSIFSTVYYLRIIRSALLIKNNKKKWIFLEDISKGSAFIISYCFLFNLLFIFIGSDLISYLYMLVILWV